jgi:TolB protein
LEEQRPAGPAITVGQGRHPSWSPDGSSLVYAHNSDQQSYVIASSVDAWNVAPQVFAAIGDLDGLTWTGLILPQGLQERFDQGEGQQDVLFVESSAPPRENEPAFLLREVAVDAPAPYLSDQVDDSFQALRQRVVGEAGWDFLAQVDNMFAFLDSRPFPGENDRSWNKAARAFDFYYRYPISIEPQVEIVREDRGAQTYWRVYLRTANQDGSQGEPLKQLPWEFSARYDSDPQYYDQGGKWKDAIPTGYYLDFTQLAADYGWTRVPAADNWRTFFQGIRYWHFENRQDLSWREAILELYTEAELSQAYESR